MRTNRLDHCSTSTITVKSNNDSKICNNNNYNHHPIPARPQSDHSHAGTKSEAPDRRIRHSHKGRRRLHSLILEVLAWFMEYLSIYFSSLVVSDLFSVYNYSTVSGNMNEYGWICCEDSGIWFGTFLSITVYQPCRCNAYYLVYNISYNGYNTHNQPSQQLGKSTWSRIRGSRPYQQWGRAPEEQSVLLLPILGPCCQTQ